MAEFCASWLAILCGQVDRVNGAWCCSSPASPAASARRPPGPTPPQNLLHLGPTAEATLKERRGVVQAALSGAAAGHLRRLPDRGRRPAARRRRAGHAPRPDPDVQRVLRQVHWGSAWLLDQFRQQAAAGGARSASAAWPSPTRSSPPRCRRQLRRLHAGGRQRPGGRLSCERVAVGLVRADELRGRGHLAHRHLRPAQRLRAAAGDAMDEVLDLDQSFVHPPLDADAVGGLAHAALSAARGDAAVLSVPLANDRDPSAC
jgi:hypothetical protein